MRRAAATLAVLCLSACSLGGGKASSTSTPSSFSSANGQLNQNQSPGAVAPDATAAAKHHFTPAELMTTGTGHIEMGAVPGVVYKDEIPGEFVPPKNVTVFLGYAMPPLGPVSYLASPDATEAASQGAPINHNPPPATGRVLQMETISGTSDAQGFAQGRLRDAIGAAGGSLSGGMVTMPGAGGRTAFGWEFSYKGETCRRVAVAGPGYLVLILVMSPPDQWSHEKDNLQAVLNSLTF